MADNNYYYLSGPTRKFCLLHENGLSELLVVLFEIVIHARARPQDGVWFFQRQLHNNDYYYLALPLT